MWYNNIKVTVLFYMEMILMKERIQGIIIGIVITLFLIGTLSFASQHSEYVERFYKNNTKWNKYRTKGCKWEYC